MAGTACAGGGDGAGGDASTSEPASTGRFGGLHAGVCEAARLSEAGDRDRATEAFDDTHFALHDLVSAVEAQDRAAAARLLEAIERTETQGSTESLVELAGRVAESIERTGGAAPGACP